MQLSKKIIIKRPYLSPTITQFSFKYLSRTSGEMKSYLSMSIAHLYYMDNDLVSGKKYINSIRETANVSIINQKYIELALVELHANTLQQNPNNTILVNSLRQLEKISVTNFEYYKHLYSLTRIISGTYKIAGNNAIAALFYTKSDTYKEKYEIRNFDYYYDNYYHNMYSHWLPRQNCKYE
ncbi:MAG: hypothetical protein IPH42_14755 [Bacteroidetes bacterium]|nr:hypothetical protein [Bacteroidota bacterium]